MRKALNEHERDVRVFDHAVKVAEQKVGFGSRKLLGTLDPLNFIG